MLPPLAACGDLRGSAATARAGPLQGSMRQRLPLQLPTSLQAPQAARPSWCMAPEADGHTALRARGQGLGIVGAALACGGLAARSRAGWRMHPRRGRPACRWTWRRARPVSRDLEVAPRGQQRRRDSGLAKKGEKRCVGVVSEYVKKASKGMIIWAGRKEGIPFFRTEVPVDFLNANRNRVPEGTAVEFSIGKDWDGVEAAVNLSFPEEACDCMADLGLKPEVVKGAAAALGIDPRENPDAPDLIMPAPVQMQSIPKILRGEELVIAAETGSGKSLAYMLPLVQKVRELEQKNSLNFGLDFRTASPLALVVCPTRELAMQACRTLKHICYHAKLRVRLVHGGAGTFVKQRREITQIIDILVATPDRLLKFYRSKDIRLSDIKYIAIDEADFLLTQGFADLQELLEEVSNASKHRDQLHYTLVTASITKPLWKVFQEDPRWRRMRVLESRSLHKPQANCSHSFIQTKGRDKVEILVSLLFPELNNAVQSKQTLVFCNTVTSCRSVGYKLMEAYARNNMNRYIGCFHKKTTTEERQKILRSFARGEIKVIVCTDIAQRGLDLPNCGHVVNFDFPLNSIDYLHRAGRTARFGEPGKVTSIVKKGDKWLAKAIERSCQLGKPINNLSADKRDYLRGGALHELLARNPRASAAERGLPPPTPYDGSLR